MKAALDAALRFHDGDVRDLEKTVESARRFHQEIAGAAPAADDPWDEEWFGRVGMWLRSLSGDQLGSVRGQLTNLEQSRRPGPPQPAPAYAPVPQMPAAWNLLDQLNGPQPYPGAAAPIGPLVTRDELERRLAEIGGDPRSAGDVQAASDSLADSGNPPTAVPGTWIRIRPEGADVFTTATVAAQLRWSKTEGFTAFVPPGAFSEGKRDEITTESVNLLLKLLAPAKLSGTIAQQVKQLVGTAENRLRRIRDLEESREAFEGSIRVLLQAQSESESDDHYCPEQPTLDALVRVLQRLMADESRIDGSMTRDQVLDEIQQGWHEDGHKELKS